MILLRSKKAYFFVIDAFVAVLILSLGIYIILSSYIEQIERDQPAFTSKAMVAFMSNMTIGRYNSDFKFSRLMGVGQTAPNFIKNYENSLLDQVGEFYFREQLPPFPSNLLGLPSDIKFSEELVRDVVEKIVPEQYEVEVIMKDPFLRQSIVIYSRNVNPLFQKDKSFLLVPAKTIIMGDIKADDMSLKIWGPYIIEVHVWQ